MFVWPFQHVGTIAENVLDQENRKRIDPNPHADKTQSLKSNVAKLTKSDKIVDCPGDNSKAKTEPVDNGGGRKIETGRTGVL